MARRSETENWQRWPHQPWPPVQPAFVMEQSYAATITSLVPMPASQYPVPHGFVYGTYDAPENPAVSSTKPYLADRTLVDTTAGSVHGVQEPLQENDHISAKQASLSPVIKSESQPPEIPNGGEPSRNGTDGQARDVVFTTCIDRLMKVIQQRGGGSEDNSPATQSKPKARANNSAAGGSTSRKRSKSSTLNAESTEKPHACNRKKCQMRFSQITHLHIHDRAHTGERPHKCTFAGCDKSFTQKGNLRTHERRHLGDRPFKCHIMGCTRAFPQKGNLAAHLETHYKRNTFRCILKSCGKTFSSRGNLKTHQNNYHKEELHDLELKFSGMGSVAEMTKADRELWDYFLTVHKNSNKGIKGRGKECRVELVSHSNTVPTQYPSQSPVELQHPQFPVSHGIGGSMGFGHFGMPRNNLGQDFLVTRGGHGYDVYEIDQASMSSGTITPASSPGGLYEDHHRNLPFHDRIY